MNESLFSSERSVEGSNGEVYEVTLLFDDQNADPYRLQLSINDEIGCPNDWKTGRQCSNRGEWPVPKSRAIDLAESRPGHGTRAGTVIPNVPSGQTRVTVPIGWHMLCRQNENQSASNHVATTPFTIPQLHSLRTAVRVIRRDSTPRVKQSIQRTLSSYQHVYDCASEPAYATWLYDVALVLSNDHFNELVSTITHEFADINGVTPDILYASDLDDIGDRISPSEDDACGWLLGRSYIDYGHDTPHTATSHPQRDHRFRRKVLRRSGTACAICGADRETPDGAPEVDAAHVLAREDGGPDGTRNGMPLCKLHHWAFDNGWLAVADDYTVVVRNANAPGYRDFEPLAGQELALDEDARPAVTFLRRHRAEHGFTVEAAASSTPSSAD